MKGPCEICDRVFSSSCSLVCEECKRDIDTTRLGGAFLQIYCWADEDSEEGDAFVRGILRPFLPILRAAASKATPDEEIWEAVDGFAVGQLHEPGAFLRMLVALAVDWGRDHPSHVTGNPAGPASALVAAWGAWAEALAHRSSDDQPSPGGVEPTSKHERALGRIYDLLCELEKDLGDDIGTPENARRLHRSIESCKFWKHPEFELKFAAPGDRPDEELQRARFDAWTKEHADDAPRTLWDAWREALHMDPEVDQ